MRTNKGKNKVKVSIIDGSFFETIPREDVIYQTFLSVLQQHLDEKRIRISEETLEQIKNALSHITDQTIIASSRDVGAAIKPRLRIMAEVHPEGNPHDDRYYNIEEGSFNLILKSSPQVEKLKEEILSEHPEVKVFSIEHKRNGLHTVFSFKGKI